jgi:putative flavoprotein involved in K+ transport
MPASGIVAASGSFSNPYRPRFPGENTFTGELSHVADYRNPTPYTRKRVVVVGAGDSAAQVANELAPLATVTIASRHPVRFIPQRLGGKDVHYWFRKTGFDTLPAVWLSKITGGSVVTDSVGFEQTLAEGRVDRRPMFTRARRWPRWCGATANANRSTRSSSPPDTGPVCVTSASSGSGPGWSTEACGRHLINARRLVYVGLEFQRSYASNTLRGVSEDARAVIATPGRLDSVTRHGVGLGSTTKRS